jgi:hypothetical protein
MAKLNKLLYNKTICKVIGHSLVGVQPLYTSPYKEYYICKCCGKIFYKIKTT